MTYDGKFYGHLVYFTDISYILMSIVIFVSQMPKCRKNTEGVYRSDPLLTAPAGVRCPPQVALGQGSLG
jgi:hypothetical protein